MRLGFLCLRSRISACLLRNTRAAPFSQTSLQPRAYFLYSLHTSPSHFRLQRPLSHFIDYHFSFLFLHFLLFWTLPHFTTIRLETSSFRDTYSSLGSPFLLIHFTVSHFLSNSHSTSRLTLHSGHFRPHLQLITSTAVSGLLSTPLSFFLPLLPAFTVHFISRFATTSLRPTCYRQPP